MHSPSSNAPPHSAAAPSNPSQHQKEHTNTPASATTNPPALTRDFHLDTFFNPVWTAGPNTFTFAANGTVVRPKTYATEPYPGYHADGDRLRGIEPTNASLSHGLVRRDPKPWKNIAITEQDEEEFALLQDRMKVGAVGEFGSWYGYSQQGVPGHGEGYTWPPPPQGGNGR